MGQNSKNDKETGSDKPQQASTPVQKAVDQIGREMHNAAGDLANRIVGALSHTDLAQKFSEPINAALARQYIKGRGIAQDLSAQGKSQVDLAGLSEDQVTALQTYQKVHDQLPGQIPYIDRDALVREVERNIETKARTGDAPPRGREQSISDQYKGQTAGPPDERGGKQAPPPPREPSAKSNAQASGDQQRRANAPAPSAASPSSIAPASKPAARQAAEPAAGSSFEKAAGSPRERTARSSSEGTAKSSSESAVERHSRTTDSDGQSGSVNAAARADREIDTRGKESKGDSAGPLPPAGGQTSDESAVSTRSGGDVSGRTDSNETALYLEKRLPPEPNEPQSQELKDQAAPALQRAPLVVPPPNQPAQISLHPPLAESAQELAPRSKQRTDKTDIGSISSESGSRDEAEPKTAAPNMSGLESAGQAKTSNRTELPSGTAGRVRQPESKILQVVVAHGGFPFGRIFGNTEVLSPLAAWRSSSRPSGGSGHYLQPDSSASHLTDITQPLHQTSSERSGKGISTQNAKGSDHPSGKGNSNHAEGHHQAQHAGESAAHATEHNRPFGHDRGHPLVFSQSEQNHEISHGEIHTEHRHGDKEPAASADLHDEISHSLHPHIAEAAGDKNGGSVTINQPITRSVRAVDTGGKELSPFGKDKDDLDHLQDKSTTAGPGGQRPGKTFVVKGLVPDKQYITGAELAFVAVMALAGTARTRADENSLEENLKQSRRQYVMIEDSSFLASDFVIDAPIERRKPPETCEISGREERAVDETSKSGGAVPPEKTKTAGGKKPASGKVLLRPQILVQDGDDLTEMAEALFNDGRLAHLIADINASTINQRLIKNTRVIKLSTRQRLSLPVYQEVLDFEKGLRGKAAPLPLITIVETSAVDRELLDHGLSAMLGIDSDNRDPLQKKRTDLKEPGVDDSQVQD